MTSATILWNIAFLNFLVLHLISNERRHPTRNSEGNEEQNIIENDDEDDDDGRHPSCANYRHSTLWPERTVGGLVAVGLTFVLIYTIY